MVANFGQTISVRKYLKNIILSNLPAEEGQWLSGRCELLTNASDIEDFHLTFSSVTRFIQSKPLNVGKDAQQKADKICEGWSPHLWTTDQLARVLFLAISTPSMEGDSLRFISDVFDTTDMKEQVAIFSGLSILPNPGSYVKLASEGIRTNMAPVFDAVALDNPYPRDHFDEPAWNQLFLKAAFMGRPLYRIEGVPERANSDLARMILDYVHERWSAGREVSPEIWRPVEQFITDEHNQALEKLSHHDNEIQRAAASMLLPNSVAEEERVWTWEQIGMRWNEGSLAT